MNFQNQVIRNCLIVFGLFFISRVAYILFFETYLIIERGELSRVALSIATTGDFAKPFRGETGPTALVAPVQPFILSLIYQLFGTGVTGHLVQELFSSAVSAMAMACIPLFCHLAALDPRVGLFAGVLGLLPFRVWMETKGAWDTHFNALAVIIVSIAVMWWLRAPSFRVKESIAHGVLWGFVLLTTPSLLTFALLLSIMGFFVIERANRLKYFRFLLCCAATAFVVLLPWSIRNYNQIGGVFFVRNNMGLELYCSNNDIAGVSIGENTALGDARPHPFHNKNEFMELQRLGEFQYMQKKKESAVRWILSNPVRFANMTMKRTVLFWFPWLDSNWKRSLVCGLL